MEGEKIIMLRATRPNVNSVPQGGAQPGAPVRTGAPVPQGGAQPGAPTQNYQAPAPAPNYQAPAPQVPAVQQQQAVANPANISGVISNLNSGILDNIDGLGNAGNYVTMDGSEFYYKSTETRVSYVDFVVTYGKRYYQWVEEDGTNKTFHDSDSKLDDRYKLKFELHWEEERSEGEITEVQFHLPTASAMRFIDYVKELAKNGYGIGQVVTRSTISRQVQKNSTNRYSRAEFTMIGVYDAEGNYTEVANGISTVNMK